jgi:hypothetical protein
MARCPPWTPTWKVVVVEAPRGRDHRLIVAVHPSLKDDVPITANAAETSDGEGH